MLQRYILIWLILTCGLAFIWPEFGLTFDPFLSAGSSAINPLIMLTMFCVGALLPIEEVDLIFRRWPTVLIVTSIQYFSMPLLAWLVVKATNPDPQIAVGILIVGCVPGAMASNVLTLTANGNVSYSVSLTTSATMLSPLVVPLTLWLTVDSEINYNGWDAVKVLLYQVVLPVIAGHLLSRMSSHFRQVARISGSTIANVAIIIIIAIAIAGKRSEMTQASLYLLISLAFINAGGYLAGYFGGRTFGLPETMRRALTLEVGMQNAGAGIVLARQLFGNDSPAVIPCVLYTFGCMLTGTLLATVWHWRPVTENHAATTWVSATNIEESPDLR